MKSLTIRSIQFILCLTALNLMGCVQVRQSTAISQNARPHSVILEPGLPSELPSRSSQIGETEYVLIHAESGATNAALMVIPIPFLPDMIVQESRDQNAKKYRNELIKVNPYQIALEELKKSKYFEIADSQYTLHPFVFAQEGFDKNYRLSLVFHIESETWMGRYLYHIPILLPEDHFHNPEPSDINAFSKELRKGARELLALIDADALGELKPDGRTATVGSLYLVSTKVLGMISPTTMKFPDAEILEEGADYVVLRHKGAPKAEGQAGGVLFGVHYFKKSLLDVFEIEEE